MRDGNTFLDGLRDGREVWFDDERIHDLTTHPKTRKLATTLAAWYDLPSSDRALSYAIPHTVEDLQRRAAAAERAARRHRGMVDRTPDYSAILVAAMRQAAAVYGQRDQRLADNIVRFHQRIDAEGVCVTHAFADRHVESALRVIRDDDRGMVVSGGRSMATLAPFADEILSLTLPMQELKAGQETLCVGFSVPVATAGVRLQCNRFDEPEAHAIFDEVHIPWEQVFEYADLELHNDTAMTAPLWRPLMHQAAVVNTVKLDFTLGVAHRMALETGADRYPHIEDEISAIIDLIETLRAYRRASEDDAGPIVGTVGIWPAAGPLAAMRDTFPRAFARIRLILEQVGASRLLGSEPLFRMAWDLVGSEFSSHHDL